MLLHTDRSDKTKKLSSDGNSWTEAEIVGPVSSLELAWFCYLCSKAPRNQILGAFFAPLRHRGLHPEYHHTSGAGRARAPRCRPLDSAIVGRRFRAAGRGSGRFDPAWLKRSCAACRRTPEIKRTASSLFHWTYSGESTGQISRNGRYHKNPRTLTTSSGLSLCGRFWLGRIA